MFPNDLKDIPGITQAFMTDIEHYDYFEENSLLSSKHTTKILIQVLKPCYGALNIC